MSTVKTEFKNADGQILSAKLELPDRQEPHNFALFAHCFTCNKNLIPVRNIARALNDSGIAVLRFDFTGLGESEGEFSDTGFSTNIEDLVKAAEFLEKEYEAPTLLIGHSLGGAAVIFAADQIPSVKAVGTIAAPSSPAHVKHLFKDDIDKIEQQGTAEVSIGGRPFQLSKNFLEDLQSRNMEEVLGQLKKPLIVLHSPQDSIVGIKNAKEIYQYARHPKSYISLDGADHLLSKKEDSTYVGRVIAGWAERYLEIPKPEPPETRHQVAVSLGNEGFTSEIAAGRHFLIADEPEEAGGDDFGPSPYEYISAGLGACTVMTLRMYSDRKKWDLQKVVVHLDHKKDYPKNPDEMDQDKQKIDFISREIELFGDLDDQQRQKLLEIAEKCPVHKTLSSSSIIETTLKEVRTMEPVLVSLQETQVISMVTILLLLFLWESIHPFYAYFTGSFKIRSKHAVRNLVIGALNGLLVTVLFVGLWLAASVWAEENRFGIMHWLQDSVSLPLWFHAIGAVLLLDFWTYIWHRMNHEIPFFWRFHSVHHSDNKMDVTTASRFHLGEIAFSSLFRIPLIAIFGVYLWELVLYEIIMFAVVQFHHANVGFPEKYDRLLRTVIVTPNMHRVHHSRWRPETDSNYSSLFSFWDRMAHTFRLNPEPEKIILGLDEFNREEDQTLRGMMKTPIKKT